MQFTLTDLLKPEHIRVGMAPVDGLQAIRELNEGLVASGHTSAEFGTDACQREQAFPTGLPTLPVAVAIPHADPAHVLASALAIGTLKSPVQFSQMGTDGSVRLDVSILFLLAIKETEKQVEMIQQLMAVIQDADTLTAISKAKQAGEIASIIQASLGH